MERAQVLLAVVALVLMVAIGAAAGTLDTSIEEEPEDVYDSPIGPFMTSVADEVESRADEATSDQAEEPQGDGQSQSDRSETEQQAPPSEETVEEPNSDREAESAGAPPESNGDDAERSENAGANAQSENPISSPESAPSLPTLWPWLLLIGLGTLAVRYRTQLIDLPSRFSPTAPPATSDRSTSDESSLVADGPVAAIWVDFVTEVIDEDTTAMSSSEIGNNAIEKGHDPSAVRTLTRTFEEVEYGGKSVTDDRIQRARKAREALRTGGQGE